MEDELSSVSAVNESPLAPASPSVKLRVEEDEFSCSILMVVEPKGFSPLGAPSYYTVFPTQYRKPMGGLLKEFGALKFENGYSPSARDT